MLKTLCAGSGLSAPKEDGNVLSAKEMFAMPDMETLMAWEEDGGCEATDGCWVEPDGVCEHGKKSWLLVAGLI